MATDAYRLEDAETDIATLRGQLDRLSEVLTKNDSTDPPNIPAAGLIHHSVTGFHKYASSDGSLYTTGVQTAHHAGGQTVSSAVQATISGLTLNVGAAAYVYEAWLQIASDANVNNTTGFVSMAGTATLATSPPFRGFVAVLGNAVPVTMKIQTVLGTNTPVSFTLDTVVRQYLVVIRGSFTATVAGTLTVTGAVGANQDGYVTGAQGTLRVWPDV